MASPRKAVELCTNIAILLVCCLFAWSYFTHKSISFSKQPQVQTESQLKNKVLPEISGHPWKGHSQTLLIALRVGCHYCEASMPFYRRLSGLESGGLLSAHILAMMPDDEQPGGAFLAANKLNVDRTFHQNLDSDQITGTPTLLLVDSKGRVVQAWIGQLPPRGEVDVIAAIQP